MTSEGPGAGAIAPTRDDRIAADLRGFGPLGMLATVVVLLGGAAWPPVGAVLALAWARLSRTPWRELGYVRPKSWVGGLATGIAFGVAFKLLMKVVVMPLLGAPAVNQAYHYLAGNPGAIPATLFAMVVGAGFGEETLYRGYMFERFGKLLGAGVGAKVSTVVVSAVLFGLAHLQGQGLPGAEQGLVTGLVFGTIFALSGRLWMLMCAHAAFDLTAYGIIYWNLESRVAHLLFS